MRVILICMALALAGCIPLQQTDIRGGNPEDNFGWFDETGYGLLVVGSRDAANSIRVIDSKSFAYGPGGEKYRVHSEPHFNDVRDKNPFVRDHITFFDEKGSQRRHLRNGTWRFDFVFVRNGIEQSRTFSGRLWTYHYVPIIDGAPN
jgi:hypothetical protein